MYEKETKQMEKIRPEQFKHEDVPLIGFDTMRAFWETDQNVEFVCVLTEEFFRDKVIERSHWIPLDRIEREFEQKIPDKDQLVVVYCAGYECPQSIEAVRKLRKMGYKHVLDFKGGIHEWEEHKMPIERLEREKTKSESRPG